MLALSIALLVNWGTSLVASDSTIPIHVYILSTLWYMVFIGGGVALSHRLNKGRSAVGTIVFLCILSMLILIGVGLVLALTQGHPVPHYGVVTNLIVAACLLWCWIAAARVLTRTTGRLDHDSH